ncbi:unnamed protein product [Cylicostephanus goldi]|uniref:Doublecortin domain-containing protein n=1 Tax=Cylicostephanus goldi TaxID=71465 RepID=A0A3P6TLJ1_CYLGO|nr:unnamed protein product [Cylicostephanus goldi]
MTSSFSEKLDLVHGVKRLYTTNGKLVRQFQDIEDKQDYVAATNHFIPHPYGKSTAPIGHPFRGVSPLKWVSDVYSSFL